MKYPIKILFVWHGAVEKSYRQLFYEMSKLGIELTVITAKRWYETAKWQNFEPIEIDKYYKIYPLRTIFTNHVRAFFYLNLFKIAWIILKHKPEIVYIKEEPYSTSTFLIILLIKIFSSKSKVIIESDENIFKNHPFPFNIFEKINLRLTDTLSLVASDAFEIYEKKKFSKKMFKTRYFISNLQTPSKQTIIENPNNYTLKVGFAGRIVEEKGIDTVILSLSELAKKGKKDTIFYIVGGIGDEKYYTYLKELSEENNVNTKFLGSMKAEEMTSFYNSIDVLVLPSRTKPWWKEQFGRVLVEAMACGTPCVGSSSGEIPRVINNPDLIFEEDNYIELANILEKFYDGIYSKEKMRNQLIEYSKNFTVEAVAKNKYEIILSTLKEAEK